MEKSVSVFVKKYYNKEVAMKGKLTDSADSVGLFYNVAEMKSAMAAEFDFEGRPLYFAFFKPVGGERFENEEAAIRYLQSGG